MGRAREAKPRAKRQEWSTEEVHRNLRRLCAGLCLVNEVHIGSLVGRDMFLEWAQGWVQETVLGGVPVGLALRLELL